MWCIGVYSRVKRKIPFHQYHLYHHSSLQSQLPKHVHSNLIKNGTLADLNATNYLLSLYLKSKDLGTALELFDKMPDRDVRSWTMLISGLVQVGSCRMALNMFVEMHKAGIVPNKFTFSSVFKCCSRLNEFRMGKSVHWWIVCNGVLVDTALENSVLDFYVKCGSFSSAKIFFELMTDKDVVSWNIVINAYIQGGDMETALGLFRRLPVKDVSSWNTIIDGHLQNDYHCIAMELLYEMVKGGTAFSKETFSIAFGLAASLSALDLGRQIHGRLLQSGIHHDGFVRNSLVDFYSKCGEMEKASFVYGEFRKCHASDRCSKINDESLTDSFSQSSMVSGYIQNGRLQEALKIFSTMVSERFEVDKFTLTSIVTGCANAGLLELGQLIHAQIVKAGQPFDVFLSSSMIDMYAKCGKIDDAWSIFGETNVRNTVLWTSMISSYGLHGRGREAIQCFDWMLSEGLKPNEISFVGLLTACSHAGLINEGMYYYTVMKEEYNIKPQVEHFTCMVDLFGRAGRLDEIKDFISKNKISHLAAVWKSFLSSCRIYKNIEMARWVSTKLFELEPATAGSCILLSNTCASGDKWDDVAQVRGLMNDMGVKKHPGQSWIQLKNEVHSFVMGDRSHPEEVAIYSYLDELIRRLKEIGYSTQANIVMQDVEEEQKELLIGFHSEKLAIAYALMKTSSGSPIRIMKNLRVCTDCHSFMKYTSLLLNREIVVRDVRRFHHFKHGDCSCGDYW
ncbi:TAP-C domain-containing protein [Heracleum sosnowskyi]|uniref:TAP-C domain-containing protein n=1 Tax=Heracleum sosnowskyi TaxID=360622 RepID=A0AAD8H071_9APIA|nr:TAP-C domain-containing protein [Heracleum sosnowskyi]